MPDSNNPVFSAALLNDEPTDALSPGLAKAYDELEKASLSPFGLRRTAELQMKNQATGVTHHHENMVFVSHLKLRAIYTKTIETLNSKIPELIEVLTPFDEAGQKLFDEHQAKYEVYWAERNSLAAELDAYIKTKYEVKAIDQKKYNEYYKIWRTWNESGLLDRFFKREPQAPINTDQSILIERIAGISKKIRAVDQNTVMLIGKPTLYVEQFHLVKSFYARKLMVATLADDGYLVPEEHLHKLIDWESGLSLERIERTIDYAKMIEPPTELENVQNHLNYGAKEIPNILDFRIAGLLM